MTERRKRKAAFVSRGSGGQQEQQSTGGMNSTKTRSTLM